MGWLLVFLIAGAVLAYLGMKNSAKKSQQQRDEIHARMAQRQAESDRIRAILTRNAPPPLILPPDCKR